MNNPFSAKKTNFSSVGANDPSSKMYKEPQPIEGKLLIEEDFDEPLQFQVKNDLYSDENIKWKENNEKDKTHFNYCNVWEKVKEEKLFRDRILTV